MSSRFIGALVGDSLDRRAESVDGEDRLGTWGVRLPE